eukprot:Filipodium_phascolosomae@DN1632_c1_g1_i1.p1
MVKKSKKLPLLTVEATIHLHKCVFRIPFKKRAPRAMREIKAFASKHMRTSSVHLDPKVNKFVWSQGIRNVPKRIRVRMSRMNKEDEMFQQEKMYTLVEYVPVETFKSLNSQRITD